MTRSVFKGTFLVVEGATDVRLYGKFIADDVKVIAACSKTNVKNSVAECQRRHNDNVVGIVDKDIDAMLGRRSTEPVFETDHHDMESTLMCSTALDGVLAEYGDAERIERFSGVEGIRNAIGRAAAPICLLMYISHKRGMNLSFKNLEHDLFTNRKTLSVDIRRMVNEVYSQSMPQMIGEQQVTEQIRDMMRDIDDVWNAVRGHDAVSVLTIGLRYAFGSYNSARLNDDSVSGSLRLAYSEKEFAATELFAMSNGYAVKKGLSLWKVSPVP